MLQCFASPRSQPKKARLSKPDVQPVGLRPPVLPLDRNARGMDHVRLHPASPQPARQPEAVPAGFEGYADTLDHAPGFHRLVPPALQQPKQCLRIRNLFLHRLALEARDQRTYQPTQLAHFDHCDQRAILIQGGEGLAQVVTIWHGTLHRLFATTMVPYLAARPIASLLLKEERG